MDLITVAYSGAKCSIIVIVMRNLSVCSLQTPYVFHLRLCSLLTLCVRELQFVVLECVEHSVSFQELLKR